MIIKSNDEISAKQAAIAATSMIIGAGILTITRTTGKEVGTPDIWLSVILGGLISFAMGFVHVRLSLRFPRETFYQYSVSIAGKYVGCVLNFIMIIFYILLASYEARILAELVNSFLLITTPPEVLIITFIWVGAYLVAGGINPLVRIFEFYNIIVISILTGILLLGLQHFDLDNLRPVLAKGIVPVIRGIKSTLLSYVGFEILLFIIGFMKYPNKAMGAMLAGIGTPMLFYIAISVIVTGVLTIDETLTLTWPTATFVNSIDYPGGFLENFQIFFIIVWVLAIYTTFTGAFYISAMGLGQIFKKNTDDIICILIPLIFIISMIPDNLASVLEMGDMLGIIWVFTAGIVPVVLLTVAKIRGKGNGKQSNAD